MRRRGRNSRGFTEVPEYVRGGDSRRIRRNGEEWRTAARICAYRTQAARTRRSSTVRVVMSGKPPRVRAPVKAETLCLLAEEENYGQRLFFAEASAGASVPNRFSGEARTPEED